jgi:hypothetical protein
MKMRNNATYSLEILGWKLVRIYITLVTNRKVLEIGKLESPTSKNYISKQKEKYLGIDWKEK